MSDCNPISRRRCAGVALLIILLTLAAYWPVFSNGFVDYDDDIYIFENPVVLQGLSLSGLKWALTASHDANWFPLTWLSHMTDVTLFGLNPAAHHGTNLLIHIMTTLLLMWFLVRTTGYLWRSAAVATLFALHPLHVESVAWASERKDVLCAFFFMLCLIAYRRYTEHRSLPRYGVVAALMICGLLAKPMIVTLPLVLLLLDYWPLKRVTADAPLLPRLWEKIPLFALSVCSSIITYRIQEQGGTVALFGPSSYADNLNHALTGYVHYLLKTIFPIGLAVHYPYSVSIPAWQTGTAILLLAGGSLIAVRYRKDAPWLTTGWFWYLIMLVPVSGIVRFGSHAVADRYSYLPLIGIFVIAVWAFSELANRAKRGRTAAAVFAVLLAVTLTYAARQQTLWWNNSAALFAHTLSVTGNNWVAHNGLGQALARQGRYPEALDQFEASARIMPTYPDTFLNQGIILGELGEYDRAMVAFRRALDLKPGYPDVYLNMGMTAAKSGDLATARTIRQTLAGVDPVLGDRLEAYIDGAQPVTTQ